MNKTNYFIECLELMDWTVKPSGLCPGEWLVYKIDSHEHLTAQQVEDKARKELIKRDGVMGMVTSHLFVKAIRGGRWEYNPHIEKWSRYTGVSFDYATSEQLVTEAISLDITPKELVGVEV